MAARPWPLFLTGRPSGRLAVYGPPGPGRVPPVLLRRSGRRERSGGGDGHSGGAEGGGRGSGERRALEAGG